jgi:hypothetical protein
MSDCARCQQPFDPKDSVFTGTPSRFCSACQCRNLFDGLRLPTPPAMLDRHTKVITLTDAEYRKAMMPKKRKARK